jgi:hypothetical protein
MKPLLLASLIATVSTSACTLDSAIEQDESNVVAQGRCTARFRWLQKDAYKSTAGRTSALWPAHTTTQLELVCPAGKSEGTVAAPSMANHGTEIGATDEHGEVILVETKRAEARGSRAKLLALAEAYERCACEAATQFLSLDALDTALAKKLMTRVAAYLEGNLECPGGADEIVAALEQGDIDAVIARLPECQWKDGTSLALGLDAAMQALASESQQELSAFHVCNNDAMLQADLFTHFAATADVRECNPDGALCRGPAWFYSP